MEHLQLMATFQRNAAGIAIGYSSNINAYDNVLNNINGYTTGIVVRDSDSIYVKRNSIEGPVSMVSI